MNLVLAHQRGKVESFPKPVPIPIMDVPRMSAHHCTDIRTFFIDVIAPAAHLLAALERGGISEMLPMGNKFVLAAAAAGFRTVTGAFSGLFRHFYSQPESEVPGNSRPVSQGGD